MNKNDLYRSMQEIDDEILEESEKTKKNKPWLKFAVIAAAATAVIAAAAVTVPLLTKAPETPEQPAVIKDNRYDKNKTALASEVAIEWPREYQTPMERYSAFEFNGAAYVSRSNVISDESLLGEIINDKNASKYEIFGWENFSEEEKQELEMEGFEIRKIKNVDSDKLIAVRIFGEYVVFRSCIGEKEFPETFKEFYDGYGLAQTLKLDTYCEKEGYGIGDWFKTDAGQYVIDALADCGDAPLVSTDGAHFADKYGITFTATSEALGVYKKTFIITEEGYLCTNIAEYGYTFEIGKEKANEIISYVKAHSEKTDMEPFYNSVAGIITKIGDGYILVDDSVLCEDEKDGIVYKIPTDSVIVRRWIEYYHLNVGDAVMIEYKGDISKDCTVNGIVSMTEAIITGEGAIVEE